jgi:hypothetical protein
MGKAFPNKWDSSISSLSLQLKWKQTAGKKLYVSNIQKNKDKMEKKN